MPRMPLPKVLPQVQNPGHVPQERGPADGHVPRAQGPATSGSTGQADWNTAGGGGGGGGRVMANRYSVGCKLGSGAFGTAFLITDTKSSNDRYVDSTAR